MGGGKDQKKTNQMADWDKKTAEGEHNAFMDTVNKGITSSTGRASDMYNTQFGGFKDFAEGKYDFNGAGAGSGGGGGGAALDSRFGDVESSYRNFMGGGGVDTGRFNQFQGNLTELSRSGGWSPERIASMDQNIAGYKDIAKTGGVDAAGQARMRGGGIFDEFSKTGGLSEGDRSNMRTRATSTIPAFYRQMQDEANRSSAVQGGYGPGRGAAAAKLSRQAAGAGADASLNAELGIADQVRAGRQWGGEGMERSEGNLQSLMSSNRLAGLAGASGTESNMLNSIAGNRINAASAGGGNEIGMQGVIQKGKMFGTQGLEGMAESNAARGAASAAQSSADARWKANFDAENRLAGLGGMQSLYGMRPGEVEMYLDKNLQGRGLNYQQQQGVYQARIGNKGNGIPWGSIATGAGAAAAAYYGGQ